MPWNSASADPASYRRRIRGDARAHRVIVGETDLWITADRVDAEAVRALVRRLRGEVARLSAEFPPFLVSLTPVDVPRGVPVGALAEQMLYAARICGVGPMAAVAGAIAEEVCRSLAHSVDEVIVENGGDIFIVSRSPRTVAVYAGDSPLSMRVGVRLGAACFPCSVCTSSGTVGPSLSFGRADAAIVVSPSGACADAAATALGNRIKGAVDLEAAVTWARSLPGVTAALGIAGDALAAQGDLELEWLEEGGCRL